MTRATYNQNKKVQWKKKKKTFLRIRLYKKKLKAKLRKSVNLNN